MPLGKLISIGGNEYKFEEGDKRGENTQKVIAKLDRDFFELGILARVVAESGGIDAHIEVITSASSIPLEVAESYAHAFDKLGCTNVQFMHIKSKEEADEKNYLTRLSSADGVMFTGGNQARLSNFFRGSEFLEILQNRYANDGLIIAGTSAGAMAMSHVMIARGGRVEALLKGGVKIMKGLNLLPNVIIDSHFITRGRFGRLSQAVAANPKCLGVGLGEDTAVLVTENKHLEVIGSGLVLIFDGQKLTHNNISSLPKNAPISLANMVVHALAKGDKYNLETKNFTAAALETV